MSLIGWWKLDGNANDSTNYFNHGTVSGATVESIQAQLGQSYKYDVNTEIIRILNDNLESKITNEFSVALWTKTTDNSPGLAFLLSKQEVWLNLNDGIRLTVTGASKFFWTIGNGVTNSFTSNASTDDVVPNTWIHVVITYNKGVSKLYINGVFDNEDTMGPGPESISWEGVSELTIGNHHTTTTLGAGNNPDTFLNDVRIYDHALTVKEIKEIARCKIFHLNFNYDTYQSVEEYNRFTPVSIDSGLVHDTINQRRGIGCLDGTGGDRTGIVYGTPEILKVNANASFVFWMYHTTSDNSTIWKKADAGEGLIVTYGIFRGIYLQFGPLGTDHVALKVLALSDLPMYDLNTWIHVGIVRDDDNEEVLFYKNGSWFSTFDTDWSDIVKGTQDFKIAGDGSIGMDALLDDFRIYNTKLSADDIAEIYQSGNSVDNRGNFWC